MSSVREILPGVHALELPLPFELETVNVYLVRAGAGFLMLDSGMGTEACFDALRAGLEALGAPWKAIHTLVITHIHPDHVGLAARVVELTGARLCMHREDTEQLRIFADPARRVPWLRQSLDLAGVPAGLQARMEDSFRDIRKSFLDLHPGLLLDGGERFETAIGPLEVLWTPGHSPGHICLLQRERRLLFSGDQILEHITPNISWHPEADTLGEYLDSLRQLERMEIDTVLPSHGEPFRGHREWVRNTVEHHRERCDRILTLLAGAETGMTANALTVEMWHRRLTPLHHHFAVVEIMAHLEHMKRLGQVTAERNGAGLSWRHAGR